MNTIKLSWADLFTLIGASLFGLWCFLGLNFYTLGNSMQSIILSTVITILLGGTALGAKILKRTSRNFKTCIIFEMILIVLFTLLTLFFSYSPFPQYFVVSEQKSGIQSKLTSSITQAENMFVEYERYAENREKLYKSKLESVVAAKKINPSEYIAYGFEINGVDDKNQIDTKMFAIHSDLFPSNYSDVVKKNGMKEGAKLWFSDVKNKIANWKPIGIVEVVNQVEPYSNDWRNKLVEFSIKREKGEQAQDFSFDFSFDDVKNSFTIQGGPTTTSIFWAIIAYLFMLLSYLITKRHSRYPGLKLIFSTRKVSINEL